MPTQRILIRSARQLLTLRGPAMARRGTLLKELNIIQDGAVLIRDGIVEEVGTSRRVEHLADARGAIEINASGRVVMPAFVDSLARVCFIHSPLATDAEIVSGAPRDLLRAAKVEAQALKSSTSVRLQNYSRAILDDMFRNGTGAVEAQTANPLDHATEFKILRAYRALDGHPVTVAASHVASGFSPSILRDLAKRKLAQSVDVCCGPDGFTIPQARKYLESAAALGFRLKIEAGAPHPDEAVALAVELGVHSISGLEYVPDAGIDLLAQSSTIATLCPGVAYHSRSSHFAPARDLIDRGAAVALASRFHPGLSPFYGMPFILALACRHLRMTAAEAVVAATLNSAYAAGFGARSGSIEPGKRADILICDARDYREIPHFAGINPVQTALKNGAVVYQVKRIA